MAAAGMACCARAAGPGGIVIPVTRDEYQAIVTAIVRRRDEEADYQAAALATAVAARIDQRIRELDGVIAYLTRTRRKAA
jgi:hypothetical protein